MALEKTEIEFQFEMETFLVREHEQSKYKMS